MQSFLLKQTDKEEEDKEMDHPPQRTTARALSLPTIRRSYQMTSPDMRRGVLLSDFLLFHCAPTIAVHLEPLVRRAVREELRPVIDLLNNFNRPQRLLHNQIQNTEARYQLHFINGVKNPTFTDNPVTDKKGSPIEVAIYDSLTHSIIPPDCFLSSAKVRIAVLNAELWRSIGANYWTASEFNQSVLKERDGKGPILTGGGLTLRLQNGRGSFGNIVFKDNSCWTKNGFCLGVTIEAEGGANRVERVLEAVSEPFRVKDRRVKDSQKPELLKLIDKVQSIKNIGKDRASLLKKNNIKIVEDFIRSYYNDQHKLRTMLGIKSESDKGWRNMVKHAMECDDEFQAKYNVRDSGAHPQQVSVDQQVNIVNTNMVDQPYADVPVMHGSSFHQEELCTSSEAMEMLALNVNVPPISGLCFYGSGSSVPNSFEHDLIGSGFAENDEIITGFLRQISPFEGYNSGNSLNNEEYHNMAEYTTPYENEFQAGYNMDFPQQVTMDEQINPAHPNWDPISVIEEIPNQDLFDICPSAFAHMPERSVPPPETTVGPCINSLIIKSGRKRKVKTIFMVAFLSITRKKARHADS